MKSRAEQLRQTRLQALGGTGRVTECSGSHGDKSTVRLLP